jgi:hypothetical protein
LRPFYVLHVGDTLHGEHGPEVQIKVSPYKSPGRTVNGAHKGLHSRFRTPCCGRGDGDERQPNVGLRKRSENRHFIYAIPNRLPTPNSSLKGPRGFGDTVAIGGIDSRVGELGGKGRTGRRRRFGTFDVHKQRGAVCIGRLISWEKQLDRQDKVAIRCSTTRNRRNLQTRNVEKDSFVEAEAD